MNKIKIAIVMGGPSSEHDVSVMSGQHICKNINLDTYSVKPVVISKGRVWRIDEKNFDEVDAVVELKKSVDIVFNALHGAFGEDGTIQKIFEDAGISYTGSNSFVCQRAIDKFAAQTIFVAAGLNTPETKQILIGQQCEALNLPVIVKPKIGGSSYGVSIVKNQEQLDGAIAHAHKFDSTALVQSFIEGEEVTCGVLEIDGLVRALPPTLVQKNHEVFDYVAKYLGEGAKEITPAPLPQEMILLIQQTALRAHEALGCSGCSRTDMIIQKDGTIFVLETNTIPGMTNVSLLPQQAAAAGISFEQLVDCVIKSVKS